MSDVFFNGPSLIGTSGKASPPRRKHSRKGIIAAKAPKNREQLARFVAKYLKLKVPLRSVCEHHSSPLDYLAASFFGQDDLVIWANRGGGKTMLAAAATILDALFRGPLKMRILGGSFDQSDRLADYVRSMIQRHPQLIAGRATKTRVDLWGGSDLRMLTQSQRAVRGLHVQKIRCDEVDLFDADVWKAVQFATRSSGASRGSIEVLSTLHRPSGLMHQLVNQAASGIGGYKLITWCLWDVIERCPPERKCAGCSLADDCGGVARKAEGFFSIDDAITIKNRSSRASWEAEMLCKGAQRDSLVFGEFDMSRHVRTFDWQADWPTYRAIDFGYRNPLVCLWIQVSPAGVVHVCDEYVRSCLSISKHAEEILSRDRMPVVATYVDPAGRQKESTSGAACTEMLASAGIGCTWRGSTIAEGIELIRSALDPADGPERLVIHARCKELTAAFGDYHYGRADKPDADKPVKDGPDHVLDALRYFYINRMRPRIAVRRGQY